MLIAIHEVKRYAHFYTWMLIAMQGVKLCAHCYARSEAICSLLCLE